MLRLRIALVLSLLVLISAPARESECQCDESPKFPLGVAPDREVDMQHIRLDLNVELEKKSLEATATLTFRSLRDLTGFSLDAVQFHVNQVRRVGGKSEEKLTFQHDGAKLRIDLPLKLGEEATIAIDYIVKEPRSGLYFFGPTEEEPNVPLTVWSQGESVYNRYWFPCFDHPSQKQTTEVVVTVPQGYEALSNGKLLERKKKENGTETFHWKQAKPHVSYLVTLAVGKYDVVEEEWNGKPVTYYVPAGKKPLIAKNFAKTREMMTVFSKAFGVDYPWEKYAQVVVEQFVFGGMENTSATTLHERALLDERAFLDETPEPLVAHELGHQWWGDLITCRNWSHMWLNESFATLSELVWTEHAWPADEHTYYLQDKLRQTLIGDLKHPTVNRNYSGPDGDCATCIYAKGGFILHMLRHKLGKEVFSRCLKKFLEKHAYKSPESADFRAICEEESGLSLERFFYDWTERPGHPVLDAAVEWSDETKSLRVRLKQTQESEPFHFPLTIAYGDSESRKTITTEMHERERTLVLPLAERPKYVALDPHFVLLAEIRETKSDDWWREQLVHGDVAARCRAALQLGKIGGDASRRLLMEALKKEPFFGVKIDIAKGLGTIGGPAARDALIEALHQDHPKVRRAAAEQLGKFRGDMAVSAALKKHLEGEEPSYNVIAACLKAYGVSGARDGKAFLTPWIAKDSYRDLIALGALEGLAECGNAEAMEPLVEATKAGRPRVVRSGALRALATMTKITPLTDEQRRKIIAAEVDALTSGVLSIRSAACRALAENAAGEEWAIKKVERVAEGDPIELVRRTAKTALDSLKSQATPAHDFKRWNTELDKLRRDHEELRERFEAKPKP